MNNCGKVITNKYDTAGKQIEEYKCYCRTTACLKLNTFRNYLTDDEALKNHYNFILKSNLNQK